ncbi:hypothetical protein UFOVP468_33 [uncultured Caudovirales phage]|uniref:Uncharacterized protein n=1 Tax=uncultured Caudovirales phage TaxID=2100421 RepID=A0A6J5MBN5_9CAUD|nr:hypothetical protein UFOVP468_33 [uncultured Caudovirales phage]
MRAFLRAALEAVVVIAFIWAVITALAVWQG